MNKILKIVKVNVLGLIAIPLLLISTGIQLIQRSLEKIGFVLGIGVTLVILGLFSLVIKYPGRFFSGLGNVIAVLLVFGAVIGTFLIIVIFLGNIGVLMFTFAKNMLAMLLIAIWSIVDVLYQTIYMVCQEDMESLCKIEAKYKWFCPGFLLLKGASILIINILTITIWIGGIGCIVGIGYSYVAINNRVNAMFGIGVWTYLKLFPKVEMVFAIIYYVVLIMAFMTIVMLMIGDWAEMGQKLKAVTQDYNQYLDGLNVEELSASKAYLNCTIQDGKLEEKCQEYLTVLDDLMANVGDIKEQVELMMTIKKDTYLVYNLGEYIATLENISAQLAACNYQIPTNTFERHIVPLIIKAEKLYKQLSSEVLKTLSAAAHHHKTIETQNFFSGCNTSEEYQKRYRALSKIYHPDEGGDQETFIRLKAEYDNKISTVNG